MEKAQAVVIRVHQDELPKTEGEVERLAHSIKEKLSKQNINIPLLGVVGYMKRKNSKHLPQLEWLGHFLECKVAYVKDYEGEVISEWAKEAGIEFAWTVCCVGLFSGEEFTEIFLTK